MRLSSAKNIRCGASSPWSICGYFSILFPVAKSGNSKESRMVTNLWDYQALQSYSNYFDQ